jgi:ferritin heavy chain
MMFNTEIINEQINQELMASYVYMAFYSYFGNTNIAYPNIQKFFKKCSDEEREHALQLINYVNLRGGTVDLKPINIVKINYDKLTVLDAFSTSLELENLITNKLLAIHKQAEKESDINLCTFIEENFIGEQYKSMKELGDIITNIKKCTTDFELLMFDRTMEN